MAETNVPRKRKTSTEESLLRSYTNKIVRSHESGITGDALNLIQRVVMGVCHDLANAINIHLVSSSSLKTISDRDIKVATEVFYGPSPQAAEACARACAFIDEHLEIYSKRQEGAKGQKSALAGLVLPVTALMKKFMSLINPYVDKKKKIATHHKKDVAGVALAASLEFITREIIKGAVDRSKLEGRKRVMATHVAATIRETWLCVVLHSYVMQGAQVFAPPVRKAPSTKAKAKEGAAKKTPAKPASKVAAKKAATKKPATAKKAKPTAKKTGSKPSAKKTA